MTPVLLPREVADLLRVPESTGPGDGRGTGHCGGYRTSGGGC
jgi:hypothetical protein